MKKLAVILLLLFTSTIIAQSSPVQLSLWRTIQIVPENESVNGFRLSVYGVNAGMTGLDLGIWNETRSQPQIGIQWGLVGKSVGGFQGAQLNFVNISARMFEGFQWGAVNHHSGKFSGLQLAIVNYTESLNGLQIGLINIIKSGGWMPWFPIFNFGSD
jgi:hypothetical protein